MTVESGGMLKTELLLIIAQAVPLFNLTLTNTVQLVLFSRIRFCARDGEAENIATIAVTAAVSKIVCRMSEKIVNDKVIIFQGRIKLFAGYQRKRPRSPGGVSLNPRSICDRPS